MLPAAVTACGLVCWLLSLHCWRSCARALALACHPALCPALLGPSAAETSRHLRVLVTVGAALWVLVGLSGLCMGSALGRSGWRGVVCVVCYARIQFDVVMLAY
jgi:hypothetical protein